MLTRSVLYLLRKPVFAAVINNLEVSPAMHSFKSPQLAAWLSPLHDQSAIRATRRAPIKANSMRAHRSVAIPDATLAAAEKSTVAAA